MLLVSEGSRKCRGEKRSIAEMCASVERSRNIGDGVKSEVEQKVGEAPPLDRPQCKELVILVQTSA